MPENGAQQLIPGSFVHAASYANISTVNWEFS
jgi:hypothetical protein